MHTDRKLFFFPIGNQPILNTRINKTVQYLVVDTVDIIQFL